MKQFFTLLCLISALATNHTQNLVASDASSSDISLEGVILPPGVDLLSVPTRAPILGVPRTRLDRIIALEHDINILSALADEQRLLEAGYEATIKMVTSGSNRKQEDAVYLNFCTRKLLTCRQQLAQLLSDHDEKKSQLRYLDRIDRERALRKLDLALHVDIAPVNAQIKEISDCRASDPHQKKQELDVLFMRKKRILAQYDKNVTDLRLKYPDLTAK